MVSEMCRRSVVSQTPRYSEVTEASRRSVVSETSRRSEVTEASRHSVVSETSRRSDFRSPPKEVPTLQDNLAPTLQENLDTQFEIRDSGDQELGIGDLGDPELGIKGSGDPELGSDSRTQFGLRETSPDDSADYNIKVEPEESREVVEEDWTLSLQMEIKKEAPLWPSSLGY